MNPSLEATYISVLCALVGLLFAGNIFFIRSFMSRIEESVTALVEALNHLSVTVAVLEERVNHPKP